MLVVLRAWTAFGVVLDAERGQPPVAEALDRAVVQVALGDVEVPGGDGPAIDLELVVLARDVDSTVVEVLDRMVGAVVAVGQARRGRARCAAEDLVAEADAEHGHAPQGLARQLDRPVEHGRVAGTVRQDKPVCS